MAAYGGGYYGARNYSYGITLAEASIVSASSAAIEGGLIISGGFAVTATSTAAVDATRVAFMSASVASAATMTVDSTMLIEQPVAMSAESSATCRSNRVLFFGLPVTSRSTARCSARLKWQEIADTAEIWTPIT